MPSDVNLDRDLARAATRAASHSPLLASGLIEAWQLAFPGRSLQELLACSPESLTQLALCLRPRTERWAEDIAEIASEIEVEKSTLESFFRQAQIAEKLSIVRAEDDIANGSLLAARDRTEEE